MEASLKKILRGISLELRHTLEGWHDKKTGAWHPGDLERRLNEIGAWGDRPSKPLDEMPHLSAEDKAARRLVDGFLQLRSEAGVERAAAVAEFVRESAYTWANRLFALRCMEARSIIEEVILQKAAYAWRSLVHQRHLRKNPDAAKGEDDGLFAVLSAEFAVRSQELPALFDPKSPAVALRPSVAALKRCVALLSGTETVRGQDPASDEVFAAPDAFGWAYQYWNADEKDRVFEMVRIKKGAKIQGADIIPATQLYTEPYMVKFLVQNSLGALWMGMYSDSKLCEQWEYYVKDADRAPVTRKPVCEITFLDPAEGSGHFHLEAFDLFYAMYAEEAEREGRTLSPREIAAAILNQNLYGIDIDGRSVQIATAALWMKAKERAPELEASDLTSFHEHLVATNIRLPKERNHLELFLQKHPEDKDLRPALELVFQGLEHADELGALLQIEELVDAVLRRLKEEADKKKGTVVQTGLFEPTLVQGTLPVSVEDYDKWKRDALNRLQAHFEVEAQAADAVQAFFGESVGKGLTFFNLLARRYDVVAANPPYMGSKNMGPISRRYLEQHYQAGRKDLFGGFILRGLRFITEGGRLAIVTQQSWMFIKSFADLRALSEDKRNECDNGDFKGLLLDTRFELLAHLGPGAFAEISGEVVNVVLSVFANATPSDQQVICACRAVEEPSATDKAAFLRQTTNFSHVFQAHFTSIELAPILYWLPNDILDLFRENPTLGKHALVKTGLQTSQNERFLRFVWETQFSSLSSCRWQPYVKGGEYKKWWGLRDLCVDWEIDGIRLWSRIDPNTGEPFSNIRMLRETQKLFFQDGLSYTDFANGAMGVRLLRGSVFGDKGPSIFPSSNAEGLAGILNSRPATYILRAMSPSLQFQRGYVERFPLPCAVPKLDSDVRACAALKRWVESLQPTSRDLETSTALSNSSQVICVANVEAVLLGMEAAVERAGFDAYRLSADTQNRIVESLGSPAGWYRPLAGYDLIPEVPESLPSFTVAARQFYETLDHLQCTPQQVDLLKRNLRELHAAGPGASSAVEEPDATADVDDEDEETLTVGARLPIPAETFLEDLAQKLEVHPISIYWLLKEGIEREGWRCPPEARRLTEDRFTVLTLRLLGHRWPKQVEAGEPLPAWADQDGVIPLTSGGGETPLIDRVRERLAEDFPGGNVVALEREFEEIVGVPLERWLAGPFFERHISQFKKRPITWQLATIASRQAAVSSGKGKKKRAAAGKPVFASLVYYHKLDVDLLPKLRTQYVGLLRGGFETEFRTLEGLANPTGDQQARRLQLEQWTDELQPFDRRLEDVSIRGFGPDSLRPALRQYGINDALLSLTAAWLRRLTETVAKGPLSDWADAAAKTELHPELPKWLQDSLSNLNHFCAVLGPKPPDQTSFTTDPTSRELAPLVCHQAASMVESSLNLGCDRWWKPLDAAVLEPLRQEIKTAKAEIEKIDEELKTEGLPFQRRNELGERKHELKVKIKAIKADHEEKSDRARKVRSQIETWTCPEAATWESWLSAQPLFDSVASLDGQRPPPQSIADFITQESRYAPDINDGVRVNIAPIQKAGLLHADVLDAKDADKAIADRAEWRADERRWVREGKLPQPGWWK